MVLVKVRHSVFCLYFLIVAIKVCNSQNKGKILSRQRRYLTFPKGSSLQLGKTSHHTILIFGH